MDGAQYTPLLDHVDVGSGGSTSSAMAAARLTRVSAPSPPRGFPGGRAASAGTMPAPTVRGGAPPGAPQVPVPVGGGGDGQAAVFATPGAVSFAVPGEVTPAVAGGPPVGLPARPWARARLR